ncbi:SSU ribosomal protein S4p (S9e) [Minicystis rosea]|nr:SSU ribosomal protein S4p (S9e) [Minicystis rosea]
MSRYTGPRVKIMRALGVELPGLSRKKIERRPYPPGQHGQGRKKHSDFAVRLHEKQKLRHYYGLGERQLRNLVIEASRGEDTTQKLLELLERRLDNVVFRAGFARTIPAARQLVCHGHVFIDGERVDISSYRVRAGQVITVDPRMLENGHVKAALEDTSLPLPGWLERSAAPIKVVVRGVPEPESILFSLQPQLVIEYYSTRL